MLCLFFLFHFSIVYYRMDVDRTTGEDVYYYSRYGYEYIRMNPDTFLQKCVDTIKQRESQIKEIAKQLRLFDHKFWSEHKLDGVKKPFWKRLWDSLISFFMP